MTKKNAFGGGNPNSLYVPMSETEQEVISRLIESDNLRVIIHGWGTIESPKLTFGDKRVSIPISIGFRTEKSTIVHFFDLELATKTGVCLFREKQTTVYQGQPLLIEDGFELAMIWDIGVRNMSPKLVKEILPKTIGLTSRVLDKETGEATAVGNYKGLDATKQRQLSAIRRGEDALKKR
jgi:hypothetical protein